MQTQLTAEQHNLLLLWDASSKEVNRIKLLLDAAKEVEMDLRRKVAHAGITSTDEGTNRASIGSGFALKNVVSYDYKVNQDRRAVEKVLARLPDDIADRVIKTEFKLVLAEYRGLDARHKALVDSIVTTTEKAPVVEIIAPKGSKQ